MASKTNALNLTDTTASTNTTTGTLVVLGGVGIAGESHIGENLVCDTVADSRGFYDFNTYAPNYYDDYSVETFTSGSIQSSCLGPDGTIYWFQSTTVVKYNPDTGLFTRRSMTNGSVGNGGAVYSPYNGFIYIIRNGGNTIGHYNPDTNTMTNLGSIGNTCRGINYNPHTKKIYCTPQGTTPSFYTIPVIDVTNDTIDTTTYVSATQAPVNTAHGRGMGPALAPNGKMYLSPRSATFVTIIDPIAETLDTTTISGISGANKLQNFNVGKDGDLYAMPVASFGIFRLFTNTDTFTTYSGTSGGYASVLGYDNQMYSTDGRVLRTANLNVDPPTLATVSFLTGTQDLTNSIIIHPNGSMYGIHSRNKVWKMKQVGPSILPATMVCNPMVNHN